MSQFNEIHPLDIPGLFMAAAHLRAAKQNEEQNQLQLSALYQQREAADALRRGDVQTFARLNPHGYAEMQKAQLEAAKTGLDMQNTQSTIAERERGAAKDKTAETQKFQATMSRALEANPQAAPFLQKSIDARAAANEIHHFQLPGFEQMAPGIEGAPNFTPPSQQEIRTMQAAADVKDERPSDIQEYEYGKEHPDYVRAKIALKRAGATNVNVGGRDLSASNVNEFADLQTAVDSVDGLLEDFKTTVKSGDTGEQLSSRVEKLVPNTPTAQYSNSASVTAQTVGIILEGGKLSEADLPRYKAMLPQPGDSVQTAEKKAAKLKELLARKAANRGQGLGQTGFKTPGRIGGATSPPPSAAEAAVDAAIANGQADPKRRAEYINEYKRAHGE